MKSRTFISPTELSATIWKVFLGILAGLVLGASVTAGAATDLDRSVERIARAVERIAGSVEKCR